MFQLLEATLKFDGLEGAMNKAGQLLIHPWPVATPKGVQTFRASATRLKPGLAMQVRVPIFPRRFCVAG